MEITLLLELMTLFSNVYFLMMEEEKKLNLMPRKFTLQWHITEKCNWKCKHCFQEEKNQYEDLSLDKLLYILDQYVDLIKRWKLDRFSANLGITGGEPFLHKNFPELLKRVSEYSKFFRYAVLTNGSLLNKENIRLLQSYNVDYIQVSLEGMRKNNDKIRGLGSYKKIMKSIKMLVDELPFVRVSMVLSRSNINDLETIVDTLARILKNKEAKIVFSIKRMFPHGKGAHAEDFSISRNEFADIFKRLDKINAENYKKGIGIKIVGGCEYGFLNRENLKTFGENFCEVLEGTKLNLMPNGDITPCRRLPIKIGNILENSFETAFNSSLVKDLRNFSKKASLCQKCSNFSKCYGGATCIKYAKGADLNSLEEACLVDINSL